MPAAVVSVLLVAGITACSGTPGGDTLPAAKYSGTGEIRDDLAPITERFPQLASATAATWMSGTLGDARSPGPSTYWIDAIVTLPADEFAQLRDRSEPMSVAAQPPIRQQLQEVQPAGKFLRSDTLDVEFSPDGYSTEVFLGDEDNTVILASRFE